MRIEDIVKFENKEVVLSGWIKSLRDHGKIIFADLRDFSGSVQIVFSGQLHKEVQGISEESVIEIYGKVAKRPKGTENLNIETGKYEIQANKFNIFSRAKTLPLSIQGPGYDISEEKRLKYRYLDLRRERLKKNLISRFKAVQFIRKFLEDQEFIEIETPILTKSTPEGARDFLVPSRLWPGQFYALPQSPQQYKQLLMVAGFEKYFQIARCFRDEDTRSDRQAEFSQLDIEMSFVDQEQVLDLIEKLFIDLVKNLFPQKRIQKIPFPKMSYQKAIEKYKTDKPDLRKNKNNPDELAFVFITDFPMFERAAKGIWKSAHHPFTRPQTEDIKKIKKEPEKILAWQYDFVLNGFEVGGGSLRTYKPEILEAVFETLGHKKKEIAEKFGHLLQAFEYGVPPHGGIAIGLDRLFSILLNEKNIREVIAFPKTGEGLDLLMAAPSKAEKNQLKELRLTISRGQAS